MAKEFFKLIREIKINKLFLKKDYKDIFSSEERKKIIDVVKNYPEIISKNDAISELNDIAGKKESKTKEKILKENF